jgi:hypothetical protein
MSHQLLNIADVFDACSFKDPPQLGFTGRVGRSNWTKQMLVAPVWRGDVLRRAPGHHHIDQPFGHWKRWRLRLVEPGIAFASACSAWRNST